MCKRVTHLVYHPWMRNSCKMHAIKEEKFALVITITNEILENWCLLIIFASNNNTGASEEK